MEKEVKLIPYKVEQVHIEGMLTGADAIKAPSIWPKAKGSGILYYIAEGIKYVLNWAGPDGEKVKVISMSLGSPDDDIGLHNAIIGATKAGVSVVCASGNEGDGSYNTDEFSYPGAYEEVVEVGACGFDGSPAYFSDSNDVLDCMAPGSYIISWYSAQETLGIQERSRAME